MAEQIKTITPISKRNFANRRYKRFPHFGHAARDSVMPLVMLEIRSAMMDIPLVFLKEKEGYGLYGIASFLSPLRPLCPVLLRHPLTIFLCSSEGILLSERSGMPAGYKAVARYFGRNVHSGHNSRAAHSLQRRGIVDNAALSS